MDFKINDKKNRNAKASDQKEKVSLYPILLSKVPGVVRGIKKINFEEKLFLDKISIPYVTPKAFVGFQKKFSQFGHSFGQPQHIYICITYL